MEDLIYSLVSTLVSIVIIALILLSRAGLTLLKNKADTVYDDNRNVKVHVLVETVTTNIDKSITAFFAENNVEEITEENLPDIVQGISDKVKTMTGDRIITFLMDTFVDNWDDWVREHILSRIAKQ